MTHWDPYTPWERLPKWARALLLALIVAVLLWLIFTLASYIAGAGVVASTNLQAYPWLSSRAKAPQNVTRRATDGCRLKVFKISVAVIPKFRG